MTVHLALFAYLSQYQPDGKGGRGARAVDVADGTTVGELIAGLGLPDGPRAVFVNGRHAADDRPLSDGDRLALFPPIAGG
jgi:sulfur carrier protein ThiS